MEKNPVKSFLPVKVNSQVLSLQDRDPLFSRQHEVHFLHPDNFSGWREEGGMRERGIAG